MLRDTRIALRIARTRVATDRPPSASETTQSLSSSFSDAWIRASRPGRPGPSATAANVSPRIGSWTAPTAGRPSTTSATETQKNGIPLA